MSKQKENVAKNIKRWREKEGLSQEELGEKLGLSRATIASYEQGARTPKIETQEIICEYFRHSLDELRNIEVPIEFIDNTRLDPRERRLIEYYRQLSNSDQNAVSSIMESMVGKEGGGNGY